MERKERVLGFVRSHDYVPLKFDELMAVLDVPMEDSGELLKILDELCDEGSVYVTKRGRYANARKKLKSLIDGIITENGIKAEFDEATLNEAERVPHKISPADLTSRLDLRDKLIFTIDGESARDFDDAVSLDILENGNYLLGVHIADVSHYVRRKTALDKEALERGTSVYLADRVIPMLPERLSNGICSLNPNEDRLTMSAIMEIDKSGDVVDHEIRESVIRSKERMTYEDVNAIFDGDKNLSKKYSHLLPTLNKMAKLAEILNHRRKSRGAIMFEFPETGIAVDEDGNPTDIFYEERGVSNKMIEEFMLAANETVAEHAFWAELPFVYRIHEPPSEDKITEFNKLISRFGITIKGKIDRDNPVHPKSLQDILDKISGKPEEDMIAKAMLRSLMKAAYRDENLGHFGLAAKYYCHFTSPIRRYPDLAVHRILKAHLHGENVLWFERFASRAASRSSDCEVAAVQTERDTDDLMKAAYMSDFVGNAFDAVVSGVTSFGMFVALENSVEGLIRAENMTDDYYEYDETLQRLTGHRTGQIYRVGDAVRVLLVRTDVELRRIDFILEKDANRSLLRKFEGAGSPKPSGNRRQRRAHNRRRKVTRKKCVRRQRH